MIIQTVEEVDIALIIKSQSLTNESTKFSFSSESTEEVFYTQIQITQSKGAKFFVISDTTGHIITLSRSLGFRARFETDSLIKQLSNVGGRLAILQSDVVAFS